MKLEKRNTGAPESGQEPESQVSGGKKPVLVYIMVLFIAAFLLMAMSFAMHQRSNQANMDELKNSVQALEDAQATQGQVKELQERLDAALDENAALKVQLEEARDRWTAEQAERNALELRAGALEKLDRLLQYYDAGDFESCRTVLEDFAAGLADSLPKDAPEGLVSPLEQFEAVREEIREPPDAGR